MVVARRGRRGREEKEQPKVSEERETQEGSSGVNCLLTKEIQKVPITCINTQNITADVSVCTRPETRRKTSTFIPAGSRRWRQEETLDRWPAPQVGRDSHTGTLSGNHSWRRAWGQQAKLEWNLEPFPMCHYVIPPPLGSLWPVRQHQPVYC